MCSLGVNIFTKAQEAGALKWPMLQTYLQDLKLAPRERVRKLASLAPPTLRKKQKVWWVSDSILTWKKDTEGLSNKKAKEKKNMLFKEILDANSHLWGASRHRSQLFLFMMQGNALNLFKAS